LTMVRTHLHASITASGPALTSVATAVRENRPTRFWAGGSTILTRRDGASGRSTSGTTPGPMIKVRPLKVCLR
jgi:hypothetical protein